jgi:WD40 repeat protein
LRHSHLKVWDLWELEKWLGRLKEWRDSGLSYLEIEKRMDEEPYLPSISTAVPAGPAGALAFSPSGDLLAVGTIEGWRLWSVQRKELLMEHKAEGVYALTFSPDGQLFAWGDAHGTVHVWQITESDSQP